VNATPFCWQSKIALRRIRDGVDEYGSALAVYCVLSVIASVQQSEQFQTTHKWISTLCGFSERTVRSRQVDLEKVGVAAISTPALKAPLTYRLLASDNGCRAFGNGEAPPLPPSEVRTSTSQEEFLLKLSENEAYAGLDVN
jgi:hypothetical protein